MPIYLATRPVDFRKGHDGLSALVQEMFGLNPFSGAVFVFRSKRADRIKVLVWDRTGLVLAHKRLEGAKFVWPGIRDGVIRLSPAQFAARRLESIISDLRRDIRPDLTHQLTANETRSDLFILSGTTAAPSSLAAAFDSTISWVSVSLVIFSSFAYDSMGCHQRDPAKAPRPAG